MRWCGAVLPAGERGGVNKKELADLADRIRALSPPDKLRLAAGLLDGGKAETAYLIMRQTTEELGAALTLSRRTVPT